MATLFPLDPEVNDLYQGYYWDGNFWKKSGQDVGFGYLEEAALQNTYLSQVSASTNYATKTYADNAVTAVIDAAPSALNTLNELAAALGDDANYATTITVALGNKLDSSTASSAYLTQVSASTTYATKSSPILTDASLTGTSKIEQTLEAVTISASVATGTINYNVLDNKGVTYYTSAATGNWTLNVRGNASTTLNSIMSIGQALTIVFINTTTATAYYQTAFQIDGTSVTPKWQGGTAPSSGNASSNDVYSFTITKTANATYFVLGSQVRFA
jgi:hypothetical protein